MPHTPSDKTRFQFLAAGLRHVRPPGILILWPPFLLGWGGVDLPAQAPWLGCLLLFQAWVFFSNDAADWDIDPCSPHRLSRHHLSRAALLSLGLFCVCTAGICLYTQSHPGILLCLAGALLLNHIYNAPPLCLNHRGGGALPQALGIGIILPCWGSLAAGSTLPPTMLLLQGVLAGCALAWGSALGDWPDDLGSKKTAATQWGPRIAALLLLVAIVGAMGGLYAGIAVAALPACIWGHRSKPARRLAECIGCLTPLLWVGARLSA